MKRINVFKILSVLLKIILSGVVVYFAFSMCKNFYVDTLNDYNRYKELRGVQNYGDESIATLMKTDKDFLYYEYYVDGEKYLYKAVKDESVGIDKKIIVLYDILEPELNICKDEISDIDSFYANKFKAVGKLYIILFSMAVGLGICWHLLNILYGFKGRKKGELYVKV